MKKSAERGRFRTIIVNAGIPDGKPDGADMIEMSELVRSAGGEAIGAISQNRRPESGPFLLGKGKMDELADLCRTTQSQVVVTRQDMTPLQLRHFEEAIPCRIVDRTGLILEIFSRHARSREGKMQVELARLMYALPRLRGGSKELSRLGAGIRTRGPGEQELEYSRRRIRERITRLKREIKGVRERREMLRARRKDRSLSVAVLVGYTNAGKSTLFSALTRVGTAARPQMFSTLDPKAGLVRLPEGGHVLLSDTVGFISDLPESLRVAFRATLEEMAEADLIVHVVDGSRPDAREQMGVVEEELGRLGASSIPMITVLNKYDLAHKEEASTLGIIAGIRSIHASALTGEGLPALKEMIEDTLRERVWHRIYWDDASDRIPGILAGLGASYHEIAPSPGTRRRIEAWLSPSAAARLCSTGGASR